MTSQKQPPADPVRVAQLQAELARAEINRDHEERARIRALLEQLRPGKGAWG